MDEPARQFYDEFASLHDQLVRFQSRKAREMPFWIKFVNDFQVLSVLDIACGTGHHAIMFKELGLCVDAMDISKAMLAQAGENAAAANLSIAFKHGDFRDIGGYYSGQFDAIVCLGNSLPYAKGEEEITQVFQGVASHLKPGGVFVVEMRNFDYLMARVLASSLCSGRNAGLCMSWITNKRKLSLIFCIST